MLLVKVHETTFRIDLSQLQNKTRNFFDFTHKEDKSVKVLSKYRLNGKILRVAL